MGWKGQSGTTGEPGFHGPTGAAGLQGAGPPRAKATLKVMKRKRAWRPCLAQCNAQLTHIVRHAGFGCCVAQDGLLDHVGDVC